MILPNTTRFDRADRATLSGPDLFTGTAAKTHGPGDALVYRDDDGNEVHELRDLANTQTIAEQIVGRPVRLGHQGREVGTVTSARMDGGRVVVTMRIHDSAARRGILDGSASQLSCGYMARTEERADGGLWQTHINVDHLALVAVARCGDTCAINTRSDCGCGCTTSKGITSTVQDAQYWRDRGDAVDVDRLKIAGVRIPSGYSAAWLRAAVAALDTRAKLHADTEEAERVLAGVATSPKSTSARAAMIERTRNASLPKEPK